MLTAAGRTRHPSSRDDALVASQSIRASCPVGAPLRCVVAPSQESRSLARPAFPGSGAPRKMRFFGSSRRHEGCVVVVACDLGILGSDAVPGSLVAHQLRAPVAIVDVVTDLNHAGRAGVVGRSGLDLTGTAHAPEDLDRDGGPLSRVHAVPVRTRPRRGRKVRFGSRVGTRRHQVSVVRLLRLGLMRSGRHGDKSAPSNSSVVGVRGGSPAKGTEVAS